MRSGPAVVIFDGSHLVYVVRFTIFSDYLMSTVSNTFMRQGDPSNGRNVYAMRTTIGDEVHSIVVDSDMSG